MDIDTKSLGVEEGYIGDKCFSPSTTECYIGKTQGHVEYTFIYIKFYE